MDIHYSLPLVRQCQLLQLARSTSYYHPAPVQEQELRLMRRIDEINLNRPYYGWRKVWACLRREGEGVNTKRVRRLMQNMGIQAVCPKRNCSKSNAQNQKFPYLLRNVEITGPTQVWSADITYIPLREGFGYLV